jgi:hypothetical protein
MRRRLTNPKLLILIALLASPGAMADQVYHTELLPLEPLGGAAGVGIVVNIHPNGPQRYAIEQYQLRHADANASYQVWLNLYLGREDCSGEPVTLLTAHIATNGVGNGTGQLVLRPEDVAGLRGLSFPINWTVTQSGLATHQTPCTLVVLD